MRHPFPRPAAGDAVSEPGGSTSSHGPAVVGLMVFLAALGSQVPEAFAGQLWEDGLFLVLGKSVARGEGLRLIHLPGGSAAPLVPPLFPLLLGTVGKVWSAFPQNLVLVQIMDSAFLGAGAWLVATCGRRLDVPPAAVYLGTVAGFLSPHLLDLAVRPFPEPLYLALMALVVLAAGGARDGDRRRIVAAGACAGLAALTIPPGVALIPALAVVVGLKRRVGDVVLGVAAAALVTLPWVVMALVTETPDPMALRSMAVARAVTTASGGAGIMGIPALVELALPGLAGWWLYPVGFLVAGAAVLAAASLGRPGVGLLVVLAFHLGAASLWPGAPERWVWIVFPWFAVLVAVGCVRAWGLVRATRIPVAAAAVALGVGFAWSTVRYLDGQHAARQVAAHRTAVGLLVSSIAQETPEEAVVATDADALVHLYTGRLTLPALAPPTDPAGADPFGPLCDRGVTHLAVTGMSLPEAVRMPWVDARARMVPVFELTGGSALYEVRCPG